MQPQYITLAPRAKDLTGQRFGRLVVFGPVGRTKTSQIIWLCRCDCGNTSMVSASNLRRNTRSCGCLCREINSRKDKTHGMTGTWLYKRWVGIITRCTNSRTPEYPHYGGRGISLCEAWRKSFESFRDDVSQLSNYAVKGYTLDRIDNDGNYEPGNVRWATRSEQGRNTRVNHMLTHGGKTQCIQAWAEELGFDKTTLLYRVRSGWTAERALTQPIRKWPSQRDEDA